MCIMTIKKSSYTARLEQSRSDGFGTVIVPPKMSYLDGVDLPNFKQIIASGGSATTDLDAIRYSFKFYSPKISVYSNNSFQGWDTNLYGILTDIDYVPFEVGTSDRLRVEAESLSKAVSYIRNRQTPFASQVFLAESAEILRFLKNPLKEALALTQSFSKLIRKRSSKNSKDALRALADNWIQYRFAVLPLISDINAIIAIYNDSIKQVERQRFYSETKVTNSSTINQGTGNFFVDRTSIVTHTYQSIIHVGVIFDKLEKHANLVDYLKNSLTDISNVALTAVEVTPWSFLVDYFVNVSDVVSAATLANVSAPYIAHSTISTIDIYNSATNIRMYPGNIVVAGTLPTEAFFKGQKRVVRRRSLSSLTPPLTFELPSTGVKYANITALIIKSLTKE